MPGGTPTERPHTPTERLGHRPDWRSIRLGLGAGQSRRGFMTSWTVTQTSRYKAAIESPGSPSGPRFSGRADGLRRIRAHSQQFSATAYVSRVTTPILILYGTADLRFRHAKGANFSRRFWPGGRRRGWSLIRAHPTFPLFGNSGATRDPRVAAWACPLQPLTAGGKRSRDLGESSWPVDTYHSRFHTNLSAIVGRITNQSDIELFSVKLTQTLASPICQFHVGANPSGRDNSQRGPTISASIEERP